MSNQAQGLVRNLDLKAPHKPILMAYANYADELGYVWAGVETIAFDTGYGVTAVKNARKTLITDGWMASKRRFGTSAIVRLNLDLMASRQVDRGDGKRIHPALEFADDSPRSSTNSREAAERKPAGQTRTAARRPNAGPQVEHEQPRGGRTVSRAAAVHSAARRPLSISDSSEDPSVEAQQAAPEAEAPSTGTEAPETDGRTDQQPDEQPTPSMDLVLNLDFGQHTRPTRTQADQLAQLVNGALAAGLDLRSIRHHAQTKIGQARRNAVTYLLRGLAPENLPAVRCHQPAAVPAARGTSAPGTPPVTPTPEELLRSMAGSAFLPTRLRVGADAS